MRGHIFWFWLVAGLCVLTAIAGFCERGWAQDCQEGAYGCGHQENHQQYKAWHRDSSTDAYGTSHPGMSCCDEGDCRPTRAFLGDDGLWRAWDGIGWVKILPEALLKPDILGDGRSHLCAPRRNAASEPFPAYCFSPTGPKI